MIPNILAMPMTWGTYIASILAISLLYTALGYRAQPRWVQDGTITGATQILGSIIIGVLLLSTLAITFR